MQAEAIHEVEVRTAADEYLGFEFEVQDGCFVATPMGWTGETLLAASMPQMRRKIWRWWHQVQ